VSDGKPEAGEPRQDGPDEQAGAAVLLLLISPLRKGKAK
jgi:hypothetical protein